MSLINSKNQKKINVNPYMWFVIFFIFFYMLYVLRSVLMPFVAGILLAYLLDPMVDRLQKLKISRTWSTLIVCFMTVLIVMPCISLFVGMIENQVSLLLQATPKYLGLIMEKLKPVLQDMTERFPDLKGANLEELIKANIGNGMKVAGKILKGLMSNGFALINYTGGIQWKIRERFCSALCAAGKRR
jgi:predicted PurR-regulated permease PerM